MYKTVLPVARISNGILQFFPAPLLCRCRLCTIMTIDVYVYVYMYVYVLCVCVCFFLYIYIYMCVCVCVPTHLRHSWNVAGNQVLKLDFTFRPYTISCRSAALWVGASGCDSNDSHSTWRPGRIRYTFVSSVITHLGSRPQLSSTSSGVRIVKSKSGWTLKCVTCSVYATDGQVWIGAGRHFTDETVCRRTSADIGWPSEWPGWQRLQVNTVWGYSNSRGVLIGQPWSSVCIELRVSHKLKTRASLVTWPQRLYAVYISSTSTVVFPKPWGR